MTLCALLLAAPTFTASAQYDRFEQPVWHPSQNVIAVSNGVSIRVYSSDFSQLLSEFELTSVRNDFILTTEVSWSPDGTMLATTIQGQDILPALQIWNVARSELIAQITGINAAATFAWNPQSTHIAVSHVLGLGSANLRIYDVLNTSIFRDYDTGNQRTSFSNIRWSPDSSQIALNSGGGGLFLLDLESGLSRTSGVLMYGDFELPRFVFSPDGRYLLGVNEVSALEAIVLDTVTDQIIGRLAGHTAQIIGLNWMGGYIATIGYDNVTKLWDPITFEEVLSLPTGVTSEPSFSPDGSAFVASANDFNTIVVRDSETGTIIASLDPIPPPPPTCTTTIPAADVPALISAIAAANSAGSPQTICLSEGTYTLTNHHNITTGRNGFPVISNRGRSLTIVGLGNGATISRWSSGNFRFFYVAPDGTLTLDNITLSNGYAPGNEIAGAGGAILNEGVLRIKNSILIGNRANTQAGAIYSPGVTQLEDTAILDSVANTDGGAIFTALTGRVEILRGEIRDNSANTGSGRGGAIYINGGYVRVVDALIQGNSAYTGGGIYITKSASAYSTLLQIAGGSRILENFAGAGSGGGLYSTSSGVTLISDALFSGNRTSGVGGGIWSAGVLTIRDSAFESNGDTNFGTAGAIYSFGTLSLSDARIGNNLVRSTVSGRGGGVYIAGGMASIHQTEFIGNRAGNGAGLYTINSDTTITNSTFQGNIASHNGGAINNNARITVRDSLFTQNDDAAGGEDVYSASATVHRLVATSCFVNTNPAESGVFSTTMNFDARNNWWGSSSGPFAGSPPGTGQVNGNIVYSPFVTEGCAPTTGAGVPESDQWLRLEHVCVQSDGSADVWRVTNLNSVPIVFWYRWTDSNDLGGTLEAPGNGSVEIEIERALPGSITGVGASVRIVVDDVVQAQAIVSNVPGWVQPPVCPE